MVFHFKNRKRLITAFVASLTCYGLTMAFSISTSTYGSRSDDRAPIARITHLTHIASSRASDDVIWHNLEKNEDLFSGDYIRTGGDSTARIEFLKQTGHIDVEQNSMILIEDSDGAAGINFIDGNLLIDSASKNSIVVKTGKGDEKINLSKSSMSLSRGAKGDVDVALLSGSLDDMKQQNNSSTIEKLTSKIRTVSPSPNELILKTHLDANKILFKWATEEALQGAIKLMLGESADSLKLISSANLGSQMATNIQEGTHFWKLINGKRESALLKFTVKNLASARLVSPKNLSVLNVQDAVPVTFSWSASPEWVRGELEYANDVSFTQNVQKVDVSDREAMKIKIVSGQKIFWRVRTTLDDGRSVVSETSSFSTNATKIENLTLDLLRPYDKESISLAVAESSGVRLNWKQIEGVSQYTLNVKSSGKTQTFTTPGGRWTLQNLPPGKYEWSVSAEGNESMPKVTSVSHSFEIQHLDTITFKNLSNEIYYKTEHPNLILEWSKGSNDAVEWHVKIASKNSNTEPITYSTKVNSVAKALPAAGTYDIEVEAVDVNGELVAKSERASVQFKQAPLIQAPAIDSRTEGIVQADKMGNFTISWLPNREAKEYAIRLKSEEGELIEYFHSHDTYTRFKKIHPGNYLVTISGIDHDGHEGNESQPIRVFVDKISSIEPPKNRKVSFDE